MFLTYVSKSIYVQIHYTHTHRDTHIYGERAMKTLENPSECEHAPCPWSVNTPHLYLTADTAGICLDQ